MFENLPETLPAKSKKRKRAVFFSVIIHVCLVTTLIMVQMFAPGKLAGVPLLSTLYMAPLPPPPAPLPPPPGPAHEEHKSATRAEEATPRETPKVVEPVPVDKPAMIQPVVIPADVARLLDAAPGNDSGVIGGVPGGVAGGLPGGRLGGGLGGVTNPTLPPPPTAPIRVGGSIAEPRVTKLVQPVYPKAAVRARIEGVVVLEATVTEKGQVEEVKVVSGPPLLVDAAIQAVRQWRYEPTRLNGIPVPILLTARVSFSLKNAPR